MPQTNSIFECQRFVDAIVAAGGTVPDVLGYLLSGVGLIDSYSPAPAPARALVDQLATGKLDAKKFTTVVEAAAHQQMLAKFVGGLKPAVEPEIVQRFHAELRDGAADSILDSLRSRFDQAAEAIAHAKSVIGSGESSPEHVLNTGGPKTIEAWQGLGDQLRVVAAIAGIASQFGCRQTAAFSLVKLYDLADNFKVDDRALAVTTGGLVADSALLMQPDRGGVTSPFYRCGGLRLHTVEEMQVRYDVEFAAAEFDRIHGGSRGGRVGEDGAVQLDEVPENPYRAA